VRTGTKLALLYAALAPFFAPLFLGTPLDLSTPSVLLWFGAVCIGAVPPGAIIGGLTGALMGACFALPGFDHAPSKRVAAGIAISAIIAERVNVHGIESMLKSPDPAWNGLLFIYALPTCFYVLGAVWFSLELPRLTRRRH
jgi:hypothetical protein